MKMCHIVSHTRLTLSQIIGSRNVALATATLVQNVVKTAKFATINDLIRILRSVAEQLHIANPKELSSGNIIRRIIKLINEEYSAAVVAHMSQPATPMAASPGSGGGSGSFTPTGYFDEQAAPKELRLSDFVAARHVRDQLERSGSSNLIDFGGKARELEREFERQAAKLKPVLVQAIDEVINELETTHEDVARGAKEHIHSSEVILTLGHSRTVEAFLKSAFRDRKFTVIVLESAPSFLGQPMAAALANHGIPTLLVPDSSLHAVMPRVTKVIFGAHSVSANGGLIALAGSLSCALAARTHAKPVVVTTGQFKFAPSWNLDGGFDALDFQGPGPVIGYDHNGGGGGYEGVSVVDPHYDYLRPELINLYVTNV
jgi:translation initiation factor eIF-2B subunit beta